MTIPPLPEPLAQLPSRTKSAIEAYGRAAWTTGVNYGTAQAAKSEEVRLAERYTQGYNDGYVASVKAGVQALNALAPVRKE
ncbi:hypothetical protein H0A64_07000 [Alcaligenaceae bacterium]|nr:hypothetical protein [Alcaligenaceae bacterium]